MSFKIGERYGYKSHSKHKRDSKGLKDKAKGNSRGNIKYVTVPYDFIPFPTETIGSYHKPFSINELPKHNEIVNRHSGCIDYVIKPCGPLALEFRGVFDNDRMLAPFQLNDLFVSGSILRGKSRSNLEILSGSYPLFIDHTEMLYRDVTNLNYKNTLKQALQSNVKSKKEESTSEEASKESKDKNSAKDDKSIDISKIVRAGYLEYRNGKYVIIPAKPFGSKNFLSLREEFLRQEALKVIHLKSQQNNKNWDDGVSWLYYWKNSDYEGIENPRDFFQNACDEIDNLTTKIKKVRADLRKKIPKEDKWEDEFNTIFRENANFNNAFQIDYVYKDERTKDLEKSYINMLSKINDKKEQLSSMLSKIFSDKETKVLGNELIKLSLDRWEVKAKIYVYYVVLMERNKLFRPYQHKVFWESSGREGVKHISSSQVKGYLKGVLYNSTNANSKRTHYLINEKSDSEEEIEVSEEVIYNYKRNFDKMRFMTNGQRSNYKEDNKLAEKVFKDFYEIFPEETPDSSYSKIIFYVFLDNKLYIGRTPYFKIRNKYQLEDLLQEEKQSIPDGIDYARAMFGFVKNELDDLKTEIEPSEKFSYKSRLRFSPITFNVNQLPKDIIKTVKFQLSSPSASAESMYLHYQDNDTEKPSYNSNKKPHLNGTKIYHVQETIESDKAEDKNSKLFSYKTVLDVKNDNRSDTADSVEKLCLKGKVYFNHLSDEELGALLLSLDITNIAKSKEYETIYGSEGLELNSLYELIGGAKAYGYGKVQIRVAKLQLDKQDSDFSSLISEPSVEASEEIGAYIDKFIDSFKDKKETYIENLLKPYIESKKIFKHSDLGNNISHLTWTKMDNSHKVGYKRNQRLYSRFRRNASLKKDTRN